MLWQAHVGNTSREERLAIKSPGTLRGADRSSRLLHRPARPGGYTMKKGREGRLSMGPQGEQHHVGRKTATQTGLVGGRSVHWRLGVQQLLSHAYYFLTLR